MKNFYLLFLLLPYYAVSQCGAGYTEPTFQLAKTNPTCAGNDGTVSVVNLQNGVAPYVFTIVSPSPSRVGEQNSTGSFSNITTGGEYYIQLEDACGTVRVRHITITPFSVDFSFGVSLTGCKQVNVSVTSQNPAVTRQYGFVAGTDTTWSATSPFSAGIGNHRNGNVLLRDSCGNVYAKPWVLDNSVFPRITAIEPEFQCNSWDATVRSERFNNPTYCLYNSNNQMIACNSTGLFPGLPYGGYYAIATDACYRDSFYVRHDSASVDIEFERSDYTCTSFKLTVPSLPANWTICLYDSAGQLVNCNTTGVFTGVPYGMYCAKIYDPCAGDTLTYCNTFAYPDVLFATVQPVCSFDSTRLDFSFPSLYGQSYNVRVYRPDNSLLVQQQVSVNNRSIVVPVVSQYRIVMTDSCGREHTQNLPPRPFQITKSIQVTPKCPGALWPNGSGDMRVTCTADDIVSPVIVSRNGQAVNIAPTQTQGNESRFIDLEPAAYVVKYNLMNCTLQIYDTVTVAPYAYPAAVANSVTQCDGGGQLLLQAGASGGIGPYTYAIIGSTPSTPSLVTPPQTDTLFDIYNGTTYSQVRLRAIDYCGNSALQDVPVQPINCNVLETDTTRRRRTLNREIVVRTYPNPSASAFRISLNPKTRYVIQIITMDGIKIFETRVSNRSEYDVRRPLQRGTYLVQVVDLNTNKTHVRKQIIF